MTTLVDAALLLLVLEAAGLVWWHRRTGRGIPPRLLLPTLLAGGMIMGALRLALAGSGALPILALLAVALAAHLADLAGRWRR